MFLRCLLILAFVLFSCSSQNQRTKEEPKIPTIQDIRTSEGLFSHTNEDGDYWLFFITTSEGNEEQFIYTQDTILNQTQSFIGKTVKITWRNEKFEEAGSGELFEAKLLLKVEIIRS